MATIDIRPGVLDILGVQGDDVHVAGSISITDENDLTTPLDLSGATLRGHARQFAEGPLLHTFEMTVVNGPLGDWAAVLQASQSADFLNQDNVFDFEYENAPGDPGQRTFLAGELILTRQVTR